MVRVVSSCGIVSSVSGRSIVQLTKNCRANDTKSAREKNRVETTAQFANATGVMCKDYTRNSLYL